LPYSANSPPLMGIADEVEQMLDEPLEDVPRLPKEAGNLVFTLLML
jgi:hypothetical protein